MNFQISEPILIVGIGGVGTKLATKAKEFLNSDCLLISNDQKDLNSDLSPTACHKISNEAIFKVISSLGNTSIPEETNILSTSKDVQNVEESLKDSLRMLYEDAPPSSVKRSILYVLGGNNVAVGVLNSITNIASSVFSQESTSVISSISTAEKSKVVMLSSVQGETHFDRYDPLGVISKENTLDWEQPECSIDCELELYQLE